MGISSLAKKKKRRKLGLKSKEKRIEDNGENSLPTS